MANGFHFLKLPGELRNQIYEDVALSATSINLFGGSVILPPLAATCRWIRAEMSGKYEPEVSCRPDVAIKARVTNCDFEWLSDWLDANDEPSTERKHFRRPLIIYMTLTSTESIDSSPYAKLRAGMLHRKLHRFQSQWFKLPTMRSLMTTSGENFPWGMKLSDGHIYYICRRRSPTLHYLVACKVAITHTDHCNSHPSVEGEVGRGFSHLGDFCLHLLDKLHHDLTLISSPGWGPTQTSTITSAIFYGLSEAYKLQKDKKWDFTFCQGLTPEEWRVVKYYRSLDIKAFELLKDSIGKEVKRNFSKLSPSEEHYFSCKKRFLHSAAAMRLSLDDWNPERTIDGMIGDITETLDQVSLQ